MAPRNSTPAGLRHLLRPVAPTPSLVELSRSAFEAIQETCRTARDGRETGGILLGHQHSDGRLVVTTAGDPGPRAVRGRASFRRDPAHAQALADGAWARDRSVWLGDWHTHPRGPAHPSPVDMATYLSLLADPELHFADFLALVVLPGPTSPVLFPWVITRNGGTAAALTLARL